MPESICLSCRRPRVDLRCGICAGEICKSCAQFLKESSFSFLNKIPEPLTHSYYCPACFDDQVAPELAKYDETLELAAQVFIFFNTQKKPIPVLGRSKVAVRVVDCPDRDEAILRLGFLAAQQGFNAVIEVEVNSEKVRNLAYQTMKWSGKGYPARVDSEKMERR